MHINTKSDTNGPLYFLAFDHRETLRDMYGPLLGDGTEAALSPLKDVVVDALLEARKAKLAGTPGLLIDEDLGAGAARRASEQGVMLSMPIERSGASTFTLDFGEQYLEHLDAFPIDYAKLLVFANPESDRAAYADQLARVAAAVEGVTGRGYAIMFELLVPPTEAQLADCGGDVERFDAKRRPALVCEVIADVYAAGMRPELWKLEGLESTEDYASVTDAIARHDATATTLVLGRGADDERVERWLRLAAPLERCDGFAIGRSIWQPALTAYLKGEIPRERAVGQIADRYARFVWVFERAREAARGGE